MTTPSCRLYVITPPQLQAVAFADTLAATLDAGDVACVQLRLKGVDDDTLRRACDVLRPIAQQRDVAFLLNDRADLAAETGCDGVHIGQQDTSYQQARRLLGDQAIIGVTCHDSRHLAMEAAEAGADYVAFGAFFETPTKTAKSRAEPDLLTWWSALTMVPCVAIGGIGLDNCLPLVGAGADFLAVSSAIWRHPAGPAAAVAEFSRLLAKSDEGDPVSLWS